jgi:hypothetical protein
VSTELGLVLLVTLLWGPTALWLAYRAVLGHRGRLSGSSDIAYEPMRSSQPSTDEIEALVARDGFWVCWTCRSLNRREAKVCYGCKTAMDSAGRQAPAEPAVTRMVPVMADGIARSAGEVAGATVSRVASGDALPAPGVLVRDPVPVFLAAPRESPRGAPACPYLGFRDDPTTRCDFPDPRNLCHAAPDRGETPFAFPRGLITRKGSTTRSSPIGPEHQGSTCLAATYEQCARYPAAEAVAANG